MEDPEISPIIKEAVRRYVEKPAVRGVIIDMLKIERTYSSKKRKQQEYEKAISRRLKER